MITKNFIFIHIPRTGGTSLERLLLSIDGVESWENLGNKKLVDQRLGRQKHLCASSIREKVGNTKWRSAFKFSIVRNPFEKVISHYHQPYYNEINSLSGASLEQFLNRYEKTPWENGVTCSDYLDEEIDLIIRYENYQESIFGLLKDFGVSQQQINTRIGHERPNKSYREYYDDRCRMIVQERYADDLRRFGYDF